MKYSLLILLLLSGCSTWSRQDIALEATYIGLSVVDMGQTIDIAKRPTEYYEVNPILGEHPSPGRVKSFFVFTRVLHVIVVDLLPPKWRPWFQGMGIVEEGYWVWNNNQIGLNVRF